MSSAHETRARVEQVLHKMAIAVDRGNAGYRQIAGWYHELDELLAALIAAPPAHDRCVSCAEDLPYGHTCPDSTRPQPTAAPPQEPEQAQAWQPIATAPLDGTVINVWLGDAEPDDIEFYGVGGTRFSAGWHFRQGRFRPKMGLGVPVVTVNPTHWMPLPLPPSVREAQAPATVPTEQDGHHSRTVPPYAGECQTCKAPSVCRTYGCAQNWHLDPPSTAARGASASPKQDDLGELFPTAGRDAADAGVLSDLQTFIRHNAVLPSDHEGSGRVISQAKLRYWIQQRRESGASASLTHQKESE